MDKQRAGESRIKAEVRRASLSLALVFVQPYKVAHGGCCCGGPAEPGEEGLKWIWSG